jgi:hypothetical protein
MKFTINLILFIVSTCLFIGSAVIGIIMYETSEDFSETYPTYTDIETRATFNAALESNSTTLALKPSN